MRYNYIIEVRNAEGSLDFRKEEEVRKAHPYLFSKSEFTIDELTWYASYGQGRNNPSGPAELPAFMKEAGATYRAKTW